MIKRGRLFAKHLAAADFSRLTAEFPAISADFSRLTAEFPAISLESFPELWPTVNEKTVAYRYFNFLTGKTE